MSPMRILALVLSISHCVKCATLKTINITPHPMTTPSTLNPVFISPNQQINESTTPTTTNFETSTYSHTTGFDYWYDLFQPLPKVDWEYVYERMNSNDTQRFLAPYSEFEEFVLKFQLYDCPLSDMCAFQLIPPSERSGHSCCQTCSCEFPKCLETATCCLDILFGFTNIGKETGAVTMTETPNELDNIPKTTCVPTYLTTRTTKPDGRYSDYTGGVLMYASCPTGANQQLVDNCTRKYTADLKQYRDIVPVYNIINGDTYRNTYCAYCNNVRKEVLGEADLIIKCYSDLPRRSEHDVIKTAFESNACVISFRLPDSQDIQCKVAIAECNVTGTWVSYDKKIEKMCQLYRMPIWTKKQFYNNPFCAVCNGIVVEDPTCSYDSPSGNDFGFSGLLKLEERDGDMSVAHNEDKCQDSQLYDYTTTTCRDIICPPLTNLHQGQCKDMYTELNTMMYYLYLKITPQEVTNMLTAYRHAEEITSYIYDKIPMFKYITCGFEMMYHLQGNTTINSDDNFDNVALEYYKLRVQTIKSDIHHPNDLYGQYILLQNTQHSIPYFDYEVRQLKLFKVNFRIVDLDPLPFHMLVKHAEQILGVYNGPPRLPLPLSLLFENFTFQTHGGNGLDVYHISDNLKSGCYGIGTAVDNNILLLNGCPKVMIERDDAVWISNDLGIVFVKGNFSVNQSNFYLDRHGNAVVCVDMYKQYMDPFVHTHDRSFSAETIVSVVSCSLSIGSLVFTSVVFFVLSELRKSLPGKTNLSLVLVLLCAQCLYLISSLGNMTPGSLECITVGIMLHFSWLLSIMWMNVCTYHMFHVLTRTRVASRTDSGTCRLVVYHVYAVIMAATPVIINISLSFASSGSTGYGASICYISEQDMVMYTFGIPVSVIILCNIGMYIAVVYKIRRSPTVQKSVKHDRNNLLIYFKLSIVTGATWIFGFVYSWTDNIALSYLFILLNAGQGVFIMFALILNRRVWNMFKRDLLGQSITFSDVANRTSKTSIGNHKNEN